MNAMHDTNQLIARMQRANLTSWPERGVSVDRKFLSDVQLALRVISDAGATPALQGQCSCLAGILRELLEPHQ